MLTIKCPYCGERDEIEFAYGGQSHIVRPDPHITTDLEWSVYLHVRDNTSGWLNERWCHSYGCGQWFNIVRHTVTHEVKAIYFMGATPPELAP